MASQEAPTLLSKAVEKVTKSLDTFNLRSNFSPEQLAESQKADSLPSMSDRKDPHGVLSDMHLAGMLALVKPMIVERAIKENFDPKDKRLVAPNLVLAA